MLLSSIPVSMWLLWSFDIANNKDLIPLGVGFGKVFKIHDVIVNASLEPQFTVYHSLTNAHDDHRTD